MVSILVTGITGRTVNNYWLGLEELIRRGHSVAAIWFQNSADPDSLNLIKFDVKVLLRQKLHPPTYKDGIDIVVTPKLLDNCLDQIFSENPIDVVLLTTCHFYPENYILSYLEKRFAGTTRPLVVGFQHGIFQFWGDYAQNFAFDYFGAFGSGVKDFFPEPLRERVLITGLPKLDSYSHIEQNFREGDGPILFCAQQTLSSEQVAPTLRAISQSLNKSIVVRCHPEHRTIFESLRKEFSFSDLNSPFEAEISQASAIVSTGSTTVIEAIRLGIPALVFDDGLSSRAYKEAGIVCHFANISEAVQILKNQIQNEPTIKERITSFLEKHIYCGPLRHSQQFANQIELLCKKALQLPTLHPLTMEAPCPQVSCPQVSCPQVSCPQVSDTSS